DHAPHLLADKEGGALKAASGMPMIQFSLVSMLELADEGIFTLETIVEKMCHAPAEIYRINERGYIREGYRADLVLVRPNAPWKVTTDKILSKCGWSPMEGHTFNWKVEKTFANGHLIYSDGTVDESYRGEELRFN
ncbi:amidohydrolase family protein, partial [Bacteroides heparinolyticus]